MNNLFHALTVSLLAVSQSLFSAMFHYELPKCQNKSIEWRLDETEPFDELVVSFNAERPESGEYALFVSVKIGEWSEALSYAVWGVDRQRTFTSKSVSFSVRTNEDTVELLSGAKATGFCVKVVAQGGAILDRFSALHASCVDLEPFKSKAGQGIHWNTQESVYVPVAGRSQMALAHARAMDLCSPTSTSCVVSFLSGKEVTCLPFAEKVWDGGSDIYGNWIFNVAQSYVELKNPWRTYLARLDSFEPIYANLQRGIPTVVSVRGKLTGALLPYQKGHLIAVIGYDAVKDRILCMDPAYKKDADTLVSYDREEFLAAWACRGQVAYMFVC